MVLVPSSASEPIALPAHDLSDCPLPRIAGTGPEGTFTRRTLVPRHSSGQPGVDQVPTLFVIRGMDQGTRFEFEGPMIRIGRNPRTTSNCTTPKSPVITPRFAARTTDLPSPT